MNKFIRINNLYYNVNKLDNIGFKTLTSEITNEQIFIIIINYNEIIVNENDYKKIINQFNEIIGEENIYE